VLIGVRAMEAEGAMRVAGRSSALGEAAAAAWKRQGARLLGLGRRGSSRLGLGCCAGRVGWRAGQLGLVAAQGWKVGPIFFSVGQANAISSFSVRSANPIDQ
jgi:hypothetical protein